MYFTIAISMRTLPCHRKTRSISLMSRIARHKILQLPIVVGKNHDRNIKPGLLYVAGEPRGVHVADLKVGDNQVEARIAIGRAPALPRR